jgi:hypothetical protein
VCTTSLDCTSCEGAQLQGAAAPFETGITGRYRCASGHERTLMLPKGKPFPESAECPECGGMLVQTDPAPNTLTRLAP